MNERIKLVSERILTELRAAGTLVQLQVLRQTLLELQDLLKLQEAGQLMDQLLTDLTSTTTGPRVVIAAPATKAHQLEAAAPSLRLVRGGGLRPVDDWANVPGKFKANA